MSRLRSYEVSIWTLQDSFITILKSSNLEHKGQILEPNMTLKDDGDNKFSFKIPMYIRDEDGKLKENPIWYNTYNGNIIANLRKIKIIFNKKQKLEEVFEFIIINVTESHEGNKKYCFVECEGLAFHELGKQGYKISFDGQDELIEAQKKWRESPENSGFIECPRGNINYWANKIFKNSNWIYSIRMDWSAYDGIVHQTYTLPNNTVLDSDNYDNFTEDERYNFNTMRENDNLRRRDKIYEDAYVSSWNSIKENEEVVDLIPTSVVEIQEKYRPIKANESNRYNLSQTLAEQFQVFCKYKYYYDDNYHIIKREAIFYNNFVNENNEIIDFTYKYNTENISRKMDSTEAVTKMFVRTIKDQDTPSGECSIIDTTANKSGEDYILNFDYMYNIGTITKEQYDEIKIYEAKLHEINKEYSECKEELIIQTNKRNKLESDIQTSKDAINAAIEQISIASAALENVEQINESGAIEIEASNPQVLPLKIKQGDQYYYCDFNTDGIYADSIKLYRTINRTNRTLDDEITSFGIRFNEVGDPIGVDTLTKPNPNINNIYATYKYDALLHYQRIDDTYTSFLNKHQNILSEKENDLENINILIEEKENQCEEYLRQKEKIISDFEKMMGPALREGKWQPEDIYSGHGDIHDNEEYEATLNSTFNNSELTSFGWDNELFDDEQNFFYEYGLYQTKYYYPCIKLTQNIINNFGTNEEFLSKINFRFINTLGKNQYMAIGSQMVTGFIKNNNTITPVLILLGAKDVPTTQQNKMKTAAALCFISVKNGEINEDKTYSISANDWLIAPDQISNNFSSYQIVCPRFQINSQFLRSPETNIEVRQGTSKIKLEIYKDFYILPRNPKWYITLKPNTFLKLNINQNSKYYLSYIISTAALAVYLDAIQVLKENAYPKVSYEINISSLYEDFIKNAYQRLGQIAHINDYEFKF